MVALPVIYKSQRNVWMNSEIFAEWFKKDFVPVVKRRQRAPNIRSTKVLLLMDNCSAHPEEMKTRDWSVTCIFLFQTQLRRFSQWIKASHKQWRTATVVNSFKKWFAVTTWSNTKHWGNFKATYCEKCALPTCWYVGQSSYLLLTTALKKKTIFPYISRLYWHLLITIPRLPPPPVLSHDHDT